MEYTIPPQLDGQRIDAALGELSDLTRSQAEKYLRGGAVLLNGSIAKKSVRVTEGDVVKLGELVIEKKTNEVEVDTKKEVVDLPDPVIIDETEEYLILSKPSGLVVHPGDQHEGKTLVDFLLSYNPAITKVGLDPERPGIVHRLDKDSSGIMVVAKTQDSYESLRRQFKLRQVSKRYLVVAYGIVEPTEGLIDIPIARSKQLFTRFAANPSGGRDARTEYLVKETTIHHSLVSVHPLTGRTHQIRVHFFSKGNPLVGDVIYTGKHYQSVKHARLMLHATSLSFKNLKGEDVAYLAPLPDDFLIVAKRLGFTDFDL